MMLARWPLWLAVTVAFAASVMAGSRGVWAEPAAPAAKTVEGAGLRFLRVYAPADRVQDWPRGDVKFVPMEAAEFERIVAALEQASAGPGAAPAWIASAQYSARLVGDQLVEGDATLEIFHNTSGDALLLLDPCGLAIRNPRWLDADEQPAVLGLGETGRPELLVPRAGRLRFDWSLQGRREPAGTVVLKTEFPASPRTVLTLDLPEGVTPVPELGIAAPNPAASSEGTRRWTLELGGRPRAGLRLVPASVPEPYRRLALVRQATSYDVTRYGVDVSARLQLDVHNEPLREVVLRLDPELQLVGVKCDEADAAWSSEPSADSGASRVTVRLPGPLQGTGRVLRLAARAPLKLGSLWPLPRIRPEGAAWQEGSTSLAVAAPLKIEQLTPLGCRQSKTGPLAAPRTGESMEFQSFSPDASLEVVLAETWPPLAADCGTAIELSEREVTGRVRVNFRAEGGEHFALEAEVTRRWLIDAIESDPPAAVDDWSLDTASNGPGKLTIRMAKPITAARPVRLGIACRRLQSPLGRSLGADELVPLRFPGVPGGRRLVAVQATGPDYELVLSGAGKLGRIDPQNLARGDVELFDRPPAGLLFRDDSGVDSVQLTLGARKSRLLATARLEAVVSGENLTERCRLACVPQGTRIDRVIVQFSESRAEPVRWSLGAEKDRQLSARRLSDEERIAAGVADAAEAWEIALRPSRSGPFEIDGERISRWSGETPLVLVGVANAGSQEGTLIVRAARPAGARVVNHRLAPVPADTATRDQSPAAHLGTFRYEPLRDTVARRQPAIAIVPASGQTPGRQAWAWSCRLDSRFEADGIGHHCATYWLQNAGARRLTIALPQEVPVENVTEVWIDGQRATWRAQLPVAASQPAVNVDLAPGQQHAAVSLRFRTQAAPLSSLAWLEPPLPTPDFPVLVRNWTVWLPPGFEAACPPAACVSPMPPGTTPVQRLFGSLGRTADEPPFDPLSVDGWRGLVESSPVQKEARRRAEALLEALGNVSAPSPKADWGAVLSHDSMRGLGVTVLVDRQGVRQTGIEPGTPVLPTRESAPAARGAAMLRQGRLAVLLSGDAALVTSNLNAAVWRPALAGLGSDVVWQVSAGPLAEQVQEAAISKADAGFVTLDVWRDTGVGGPTPPSRGDATLESVDTPEWTAYLLEVTDGVPVRLEVVYLGRRESVHWAVVLAVAAAAAWLARRSRRLVAIAAGGAGVLALMVPESWVPVCSGAVVGAMAGLAWWMAAGAAVRRTPPADARRSGPGLSRHTIAQSVPMAGLVAAIVILGARHGLSDGPSPGEPASPPPRVGGSTSGASTVYRVFIPTDDKERPAGDRYQVPEPFYQELRRREQAMAQEPRGWILRNATYRGELAWDVVPNRMVLARLSASFDVEILGGATRLTIPLGREGANLAPGETLLDGRPIEPDWLEGGASLAVNLPEKTRSFRLDMTLRPAAHRGGPGSEIDLAIPRVPGARLELALPVDAPAVEVPSSLGAVKATDETNRRLVADLGPTERLVVRWPERTGAAAGANLAIDHLLWLKLQPGSAVLDARFRLKVTEGQVRQLRLVADPRLRLLPLEAADAPTVRSTAKPGQPQVFELEFPQPIVDQAVVDLRFLLGGTSGLGNIRLPMLDVGEGRCTRRWLAVTVDAGLGFSDPPPERPDAVAVPEFLSAWGKADVQPGFVDSLTPGDVNWSLFTWARSPKTSGDQVLALGFGEKAILLRYDARLTTTGGYSFQYRLSAPPELEVQSVSVLEGKVERAYRWSRGPEGKITVFLNGPVAGRHDLSLRGRLPAIAQGRRALPCLEVEGVPTEGQIIELYRRPEVSVRLVKSQGLVELETLAGAEGNPEFGRLVARRSVDNSQTLGAEVAMAANRPEVQATVVTSLRPDGEAWEAAVDLTLDIRRGVVDELRLDVPATWSGPYKCNPPMAVERMDPVDGGPRQVVLRPAVAIAGTFRGRVTGPLSLPAGRLVAVPDIALRGAESPARTLVLPTQRQLQPIAWETRGLEKTDLPNDFVVPAIGPETFAAYRVVEKDFQANLRPVSEEADAPQVALADIRLAWQADAAYYGAAAFDLIPAGEAHVPIQLPPGCRLVQTSVEGSPVAPLAGSGQETWTIPLASDSLPQHVEVVFTGVLADPDSTGTRRFMAPRVSDWPVKTTLWNVSAPPNRVLREPEGVGQVSALRQETYRLRTLATLIEHSTANQAAHAEDFARWYRTWTARFEARRAGVRALLALPPEADFHRTVRAETQAMDLKQAQIAESLGMADVRAAARQAPAEGCVDRWSLTLDRPDELSRCVVHGLSDHLDLRYSAERGGLAGGRWGQTAILSAIAVAGLLFARRRAAAVLCERWPHILLTGVGLAWWLWLWPSALGWLLVVWGVTVSMRTVWRRRSRLAGRTLAVGTAAR